MIGLVCLAMPILGTANPENHVFEEGVDNITISKSAERFHGCRFRMSRREEGEEDVVCCYGEPCDPDEQSRECREQGDYIVEKNIKGTVGECVLRLKGKARLEDAGNYNAEFLGNWDSNKPFKINIMKAKKVDNGKKAGLHPVMIPSLGSLLFVVFVFVVLWKKRKDRLESCSTQDIEAGESSSRREMVALNEDQMENN